MIFKNEMAFKAQIKRIAGEKGLLPQQVQQCYLIERFLMKLASSEYSNQFIIKGGFLIGSLIGIGSRTTMDLDATIKDFHLNKESLNEIITSILAIKIDDSFSLSLLGIEDIREADNYPGYRVKIQATFNSIIEQITLDVTTGDRLIPSEINHTYQLIIENNLLQLSAYNLETLLAEKIETVMSRREANTRPRDYYDLYSLTTFFHHTINLSLLKKALQETATRRGTNHLMKDVKRVVQTIRNSEFQKKIMGKISTSICLCKRTGV